MEPKCNLIIDSCCDLPADVVNRAGVDMLKFPYLFDGEERVDDLYASMEPKEFYDAMRDAKRLPPTTAQVPTTVLAEAFQRALDSGVPTVYLSFSSGLSGSFDAAVLVRDALTADYPDGELYLVDTQLASIAEAVLVLGAIEQRQKGLTAREMAAWAEEARYYVRAQFMVDDFDALRRGGRIPAGVALAGSKLDLKPLLGFDLGGRLSLTGMVRGRKKGIRGLVDYYEKHRDPSQLVQRVVVGDADAPKDGARLRDEAGKVDQNALFLETSIGPVIGSHVGPGMVAIAFWGTDRRRDDTSVADRIARRVKERD